MSEYYVYRLIDPRDFGCFYVGKGRGDRAWLHQKAARSAQRDNHLKRARILEIVTAGLDVKIEIVARFADEQLAYAHEYDLIQNTPNLTNIAPGRRPPPTAEQMAEANRQAQIARGMAKAKQLGQFRSQQHKRFLESLPPHLQTIASEWLENLKAEQVQITVPSSVRAQEYGGKRIRTKKRRLRRKYPTSRKAPVVVTEAKLPPAL